MTKLNTASHLYSSSPRKILIKIYALLTMIHAIVRETFNDPREPKFCAVTNTNASGMLRRVPSSINKSKRHETYPAIQTHMSHDGYTVII